MAMSASRPDSIRVLHHTSPPVPMSVTRSPSRIPFFRNAATATLARWAWGIARWIVSKRITNVRPVRASGSVLVEMRGGSFGVAEGAAGSWTASKLAIVWGSPSSLTTKSVALRSGIGAPFLSVTTRSTVTSSTWEGKVGVASPEAGDGDGVGRGGAGACARSAPGTRMMAASSVMSLLSTPRICHTTPQKSTPGRLDRGVPSRSDGPAPAAWRTPARGDALELKDPSLLLLRDEVGDCYESVTRSVAAAMGAESCHLALYDAARREVVARRPPYIQRTKGVPQYRFPLDSSAASTHVIETQQPHLSNDPQSDPLYDPSIKEHGVQSVLTAPVHRDGRVVALLYVLNKPGGFDAGDAADLMMLAPPVGLALENIRLYAAEKDRRVLHESLPGVWRGGWGPPI